MEYLEERHATVSKGRALDFGCGVGRLTQALARHFNLVERVDIVRSMIELSNKFNRYGDRCKYHVSGADLSMFDDETFDFMYSNLVLQHIKPEYSRNYIKEFLRMLAPKGVLVFDLATEASTFRGKAFHNNLSANQSGRCNLPPILPSGAKKSQTAAAYN
jgi:2-polyprenyl-3-methyl-5-hydroxy-6-metoxy-1,4-benzoquinol methylase